MDSTDRAEDLTGRQRDLDERHEGNRATADMDQAQPTREPTRDRQIGQDRQAELAERDSREG